MCRTHNSIRKYIYSLISNILPCNVNESVWIEKSLEYVRCCAYQQSLSKHLKSIRKWFGKVFIKKSVDWWLCNILHDVFGTKYASRIIYSVTLRILQIVLWHEHANPCYWYWFCSFHKKCNQNRQNNAGTDKNIPHALDSEFRNVVVVHNECITTHGNNHWIESNVDSKQVEYKPPGNYTIPYDERLDNTTYILIYEKNPGCNHENWPPDTLNHRVCCHNSLYYFSFLSVILFSYIIV